MSLPATREDKTDFAKLKEDPEVISSGVFIVFSYVYFSMGFNLVSTS